MQGKDSFDRDPKLQVWVLYHLQIIGEACRSLTAEFLEKNSDPAWSKAVGLRNILIHHYFDIDEALVWQVVERDLPQFRRTVEAALEFH